MVLTPDGEEFMEYARDILNRIDRIEQSYRDGSHKKRKFSISAPRACYISAAMAEFSYVLIMSRDNPLSAKESITYDDLSSCIEIAHADPYVPTLSMSKVFREELPDKVNQRIFVFERASQFDLLSENPKTFMWYRPLLSRYWIDTVSFSACARVTRRYTRTF